MITPATTTDLDSITSLHLAELGNTPNSQVGRWLITKLYTLILRRQDAQILVAKNQQAIVGVVSFGYDLAGLTKAISRDLSLGEIVRIILTLFTKPISLISQIQHRLFMYQAYTYLPPKYLGILTICIDSAHQGHQIGSKLIAHVFASARTQHVPVFVDTYLSNRRAIRFYEKNGFHRVYQGFGNVLLTNSV